MKVFLFLLVVYFYSSCNGNNQYINEKLKDTFSKSSHTNNWAVLVCTSRFWFNYRHVANALSLYRSVKRLGIPDSQIILMLADDMACNPRNPRPGAVYNHKNQAIDVYGSDVEVDYRGYEVTAENFIRVLTGRLPPDTPRTKRLSTDDRSNVLVYMTGHGGENFLKFQDSEEITNVELGDAFEQMWQKKRYNELLFIIDTCQAVSLFSTFYSPNIVSIASSLVGEDSLSHHIDPAIGVFIIDRYTYYLLEFLESTNQNSRKTMTDLFKVCPKSQCISTVGIDTKLFSRDPAKTFITDFFGSIRAVDVDDDYFEIRVNMSKAERASPALDDVEISFSKVDSFLPESVAETLTSSHPLAPFASSAFFLLLVGAIVRSLLR